ncbi:glycosyltransferase 87 family protein [Micromonospora pattaloongensis]|uniref:glycosyltransferase 87 family protein n=1 Tax=Micromonospora pattaloongensis TaxID=405436 RepID=UPI000B8545BC|nr:glycosyltransferase 87 family protein [Micromonospora pattaloongensis]
MSPNPSTGPARLRSVARRIGGLGGDLLLYGLSALFAAVTAVTSTLAPHRAWGAVAMIGYAAAALAAAVQLVARRRGVVPRLTGAAARATVTAVAWAAVALLPMLLQCVQRAGGRPDRAQEEVVVVEDGGLRLLHDGTPYLGREVIAALPPAEQLLGYLPYQPGMALFGLPRAVAGVAWWTDARVWFAVATTIALAAALTILARRRPDPEAAPSLLRAAQLATVLPVCALTLATGGDDLPVLAFCLLALALCAAGRHGAAGLTVGFAGALKLFAWPVTLVLLAYAATRGRRTALRFAVGGLGLPLVALVPAQLVDADALVENVVLFPLGRGLVTSPAQSPLPGHLIAATLPAGRAIAAALLVAAGLAIAVRLARRPPRTAADAAVVCGYGLLAAMLLMPATRFGYLLYPVAFLAWAPALRLVRAVGRPTGRGSRRATAPAA